MKPTLWMEDARRVRRRRSAMERARYLEQFARSGQSVPAFCREHGLCVQTFYYWRQKARRTTLPVAAPAFAQVAVPALSASAGPVCIHLAGDLAIEAAAGTDAVWLAQVVRALRARP